MIESPGGNSYLKLRNNHGRKKMRKISFVLIVTLLLLGCATPAKYDKKLNAMVGQSRQTLIKDWGRPSASKILANGDEVITYTKANNVYVPSEFYLYNQGFEPSEDVVYSPFMNDYDFSPYGQTFGYQVEYVCQTAFLLQNGQIIGWKWRGNDCVSY